MIIDLHKYLGFCKKSKNLKSINVFLYYIYFHICYIKHKGTIYSYYLLGIHRKHCKFSYCRQCLLMIPMFTYNKQQLK